MFRYYFIVLVLLFSCRNKTEGIKDFSTTKSKMDYKIISSPGGGDSIMTGDIVKVHLRQFIDDSLLSDTHTGMPVYVKIDSTLRDFDFTEILPFMKVNDSAICIFSVKEIMKKAPAEARVPQFLAKGKAIRVFLNVVDKFKSDSLGQSDYRKEQHIYDSLTAIKDSARNIKAATSFDSLEQSIQKPFIKLPNGVCVKIQEKGKGLKITKGDSVAVIYKGMLANGTLFDSNTKQNPYLIRAGMGESVEGFDSGILSLSFGDKAKIYIPAQLGYGARGSGERIPPFSNLVFEVEVNDGRKSR